MVANPNTPMGLVPVRRIDGMPWNSSLRRYQIPATNTSAYYLGDPVIKLAANADANGVPAVVLATAGTANKVTGVICGFEPKPGWIGSPGNAYRPAAAQTLATYVYVCDDPSVLFEVQCDSGGGEFAAASVGKNANLLSGSGSPYTGWSGWLLDTSSVGTGATLQVNVISGVPALDNTLGQAYSKVLVRINTDSEVPNSAGI